MRVYDIVIISWSWKHYEKMGRIHKGKIASGDTYLSLKFQYPTLSLLAFLKNANDFGRCM